MSETSRKEIWFSESELASSLSNQDYDSSNSKPLECIERLTCFTIDTLVMRMYNLRYPTQLTSAKHMSIDRITQKCAWNIILVQNLFLQENNLISKGFFQSHWMWWHDLFV